MPPEALLEGVWCWGCARRFVPKGQPTKGPLDAVTWREGLCGKPDCAVNGLLGVR